MIIHCNTVSPVLCLSLTYDQGATLEKIRLGVSSCLLGKPVRYDGGHKRDHFLTDTLGAYVDWVPVCPEVECGLPVPREAMHLVGDVRAPRLVTIRTGVDHTSRMRQWATKKTMALATEDLCGFVFKSRSPSSGMCGVKIYSPEGVPIGTGAGLFAKAFQERYPLLPVEDEGRLHDPVIRENFIERVFVYKRWREFRTGGRTTGGLVSFHTYHKLLVMAHSPKHYAALGRLVADPKKFKRDELFGRYFKMLMEGLQLLATIKKNTNVLQHISGYFKKQLTADEKRELQDVIANYHRELIPIIVPITLLQHFIRKYNVEYLRQQAYLNPHPLELMLRNHV
jgi:uncharacterized protein YbgA (DUF1722 family)/uncharacterized protein YbbK (DUF523 family)